MAKVAIQGGVKNYLPSREVTVPVEAKSSKNHVKAHLAYITDKEQKLLLEKNLHGSLKGKPNRGPGGLPSLQGDFGPGGNNPGGFSSNQGGKGGTGNTGDKGGIGRGDESAFKDTGTGNYELSTDPTDQQAVNDYVLGKMAYQKGKKPSFFGGPGSLKQRQQVYDKKRALGWAAKQRARKIKGIDDLIAETYVANPHMDISEIRDALMSQYDATNKTMTGLESFNTGKLGMNYGPTQLGPLGLNTKNVKGETMSTDYLSTTPSLDSRLSAPGMLGFAVDKLQGPVNVNNLMSSIDRINQIDTMVDKGITQTDINDYYDKAQGKGKYDIFGGGGGDNQSFIPINYNTGAAEVVEPYTNDFTYRFGDTQGVGDDVTKGFYAAKGGRAGKAEGGIMGTRARRAMGGIMSRVDQRQGYGFGSIVKSITKPFKSVAKAAGKVLKSDLGKAALFAVGAYYAPTMFGGTAGFGSGSTYGKAFSALKNSKLATGIMGLKDSYSGMGKLGKMATMGGIGLGLSMIPGLNTPKVDQMPGGGGRGGGLKNSQGGEGQQAIRDEIYEAYESGDQDKIMQLQKFYGYKLPSLDAVQDMSLPSSLPYPNYAEGGRIGYSLGNLVGKSAGVFQPTSASMSAGDAPSFEGGTGMGGMIADLIRKNPNMFKRSKNSTPINQNNNGMYSKMFNNSKLFNQLSNNNDFIDENMNGIDDREEVAMGGRIGKAEGGLMDLGGMEKDYRAEGGFVPIGEYEKKDDVPARLSVNEFVFTADAVRGAGQGDIDKGAEIMENMMENLENGGTISEESQGKNGAQQMFETSQRLGEVV